MDQALREKIATICEDKIRQKGENVQVSFYAFFANKNDDPERLMSAARWWIEKHAYNHFEKASKIYAQIKAEESVNQSQSIGGLNHITLTVFNLARSLAFYQETLGFHGHVSWHKGAYLSLENCWLCLTLGEPQVSQDYSHFAFSCNQAKMQDLITRRDELSLRIWQSNSSEGDSLYLLDPDGHKLELHQGNLASRLAYLKSHPYDGLKWL